LPAAPQARRAGRRAREHSPRAASRRRTWRSSG